MKTRLLICLVIFVCFGASFAMAEEWPQWLGPTRNSVWNEKGIIRQFPKDGPKVLWKSKVSGGFSGPAVIEIPPDAQKMADETQSLSDAAATESSDEKKSSITSRIVSLEQMQGSFDEEIAELESRVTEVTSDRYKVFLLALILF